MIHWSSVGAIVRSARPRSLRPHVTKCLLGVNFPCWSKVPVPDPLGIPASRTEAMLNASFQAAICLESFRDDFLLTGNDRFRPVGLSLQTTRSSSALQLPYQAFIVSMPECRVLRRIFSNEGIQSYKVEIAQQSSPSGQRCLAVEHCGASDMRISHFQYSCLEARSSQ